MHDFVASSVCVNPLDTEWDNATYNSQWQKWNLDGKHGIYGLFYLYHCAYIGSSINLKQRASRFFFKTQTGNDNIFLQAFATWAKKDMLYIKVKTGFDKNELISMEQKFIDRYKPQLNMAPANQGTKQGGR